MQMTEIKRNQNMVAANEDVMEETLFSVNVDAGFDEIEMGMADDAVELVISMLTDLSADRGAYALRETFSNAYDATVVAGDMSLPIEIELPASNPFEGNIASALGYGTAGATVTVRDHGCGMTEDDVRSYFTQYGGSKKRTTADVDTIGSKGLGSKAPLAVADTFRVRTVKDGYETTAILERKRGKNWASIKSVPSDAANGTEVVFPIQDSLVYEQVASCVKDIARFAIDANVLVNGEKIAPAIKSGENTDDYIYIGEVTIGTDENGAPATFKLWESTEAFPEILTENSHVAFSLAGVNYTLQQRSRYASFGFPFGDSNPTFILEGAPGYLNFTPSRDEIKKDGVREAFVTELLTQARKLDYSHAVIKVLSAKESGYERMHWLFKVYDSFTACEESDTVTASRNTFRSFGPAITAVTVPFSVLDADDSRKTYRAVLPPTDSARVYFTLSGKNFTYGVSGTSECQHTRMVLNKIAKGKWQEEIFANEKRRVTVVDTAYDVLRHSYDSRSSWHRDPFAGKDISDACVVIYGIDDTDNVRKLLNCEKSLRTKLDAETVAYIFSENKLGDSDLDALAGAFKTVIELECADAIEQAKEYASKVRKAAPARSKHDEEIDWSKIETRVYKLADDVMRSCNTVRRRITDYEWSDASRDVVALIPFNIARDTADLTVANQLAACDLLRKLGALDMEYVAFCDVKNAQIKQLAREGWTFAADLRKNVKTHPDNIVDELEYAQVAGADGRTIVIDDGAIEVAAKCGDEKLTRFLAASCAAGRFYADTYMLRDSAGDYPYKRHRVMIAFMENFGSEIGNGIIDAVSAGELPPTITAMLPILGRTFSEVGKGLTPCLAGATIDNGEKDCDLARGAYDAYRLVKAIYDMMSTCEFDSLVRVMSDGYAELMAPGMMNVVRELFGGSDK